MRADEQFVTKDELSLNRQERNKQRDGYSWQKRGKRGIGSLAVDREPCKM